MKQGTCGHLMDKFHELRSSLADPGSGKLPRVISVVSAGKGEGKTTVAACLAMSIAKHGRVAIVDANIRSPGLADFFDLPRARGISEVLLGMASLGEIVREAAGVHVACAGMETVADPLGLLGSPAMGKLVEELRNGFDTVILDSPPLADHRDGVVTSRHADCVLFVIARGMVSKERVRRSLHSIEGMPLGIVFNRDRA